MIKQLEPVVVPDDFAEWFHPDLRLIDPRMSDSSEKPYSKEEWEKLNADGGVSIKVEVHDFEDICEATGGDDLEDWSGWNPEPPSPKHFLISAFSTEDAVILWWAIKASEVA